MRSFVAISLLLLLTAMQGCGRHAQSASAPQPALWMLAFDGQSNDALVNDPRFTDFLKSHVQTHKLLHWTDKSPSPAVDAGIFAGRQPDVVHVNGQRYVTMSACVPADCTDSCLLWVDTSTGTTVFAPSIYDQNTAPMGAETRFHLFLFTNISMRANGLPVMLTNAIAQWSARPLTDESHNRIGSVTLVQPNGSATNLALADVHAWAPQTQMSAK